MSNMYAQTVQSYIVKMSKLQDILLCFLDNDDESSDEDFNSLINYLKEEKITGKFDGFKEFLHLLSKISDNYYRKELFFSNVERILKYFRDQIKQNFSNYSIFNIFKKNKRILLFLFEEKIIIPDKSIATKFCTPKYRQRFYPEYFFYEFKSLFSQALVDQILADNPEISNIDSFNDKRKIGINNTFFGSVIHDDLIDEFVSHHNQTNISLQEIISPSIFETNLFLLKTKAPTLIEYAALCRSTLIFNYLLNNNLKLTSSLWIYAVHGQNADVIHLLEQKKISPPDNSYIEYLEDSVKCHHLDLMNYFQNFYDINEHIGKFLIHSIKYFNFNNFILDIQIHPKFIFQFCKYDHISLVYALIKDSLIDIEAKTIKNFDIF